MVYGSDSSVHAARPWVIVRPENTEQVQAIMKLADDEKIPVIKPVVPVPACAVRPYL